MKKISTLFLLTLALLNVFGQHDTVPQIFTVVEYMPSFPGGEVAKNKFVSQNLVIPQSAVKNKTFGKCFIKFTVMKDGSIKDPKILKGVPNCSECDEEAMRIISLMPVWDPGKQNGHKVNTFYNFVINFQPK